MNASPPSPDCQAARPEMVARLMAVLRPLAALVAAEFLRNPKLAGLIRPLWQWLMHAGRRFSAVRLTSPARKSRAGAVRAAPAERKKPRLRLPGGRGWLRAALGYKGGPSAAQLEILLDDPAMRALLDSAPGFGRVLRPIAWMLGISRRRATSAQELDAVKLDAAGQVVARRPERPWPRRGKMVPVRLIYPPVERVPPIPPEIAWNFAKSR